MEAGKEGIRHKRCGGVLRVQGSMKDCDCAASIPYGLSAEIRTRIGGRRGTRNGEDAIAEG